MTGNNHVENPVVKNTLKIPEAFIALFFVPPTRLGITSNVIAFTSLLMLRIILIRWKAACPLSLMQWIKEVMSCLRIEKLRFTLKGSVGRYNRTWMPFTKYVEKLED